MAKKPFWIKKAGVYWKFTDRQHYVDYVTQLQAANGGGKVTAFQPFPLNQHQMDKRLAWLHKYGIKYANARPPRTKEPRNFAYVCCNE